MKTTPALMAVFSFVVIGCQKGRDESVVRTFESPSKNWVVSVVDDGGFLNSDIGIAMVHSSSERVSQGTRACEFEAPHISGSGYFQVVWKSNSEFVIRISGAKKYHGPAENPFTVEHRGKVFKITLKKPNGELWKTEDLKQPPFVPPETSRDKGER